jgi:hypothetical protein
MQSRRKRHPSSGRRCRGRLSQIAEYFPRLDCTVGVAAPAAAVVGFIEDQDLDRMARTATRRDQRLIKDNKGANVIKCGGW